MHDAAQIALDQSDAGALHRDIRAGAHRDADVGGASAGASLMPSPAMATTLALFRCRSLHALVLVLRLRPPLRPRRSRVSSPTASAVALVVAGEHHDLDAELMQMARSLPASIA